MKLPSSGPLGAQRRARKARQAFSRPAAPRMTLRPSTVLLALLLVVPVWALVVLVIYFW